MYKIYTFTISLFLSFSLFGQADNLNMELLSNLSYSSNLSDIWGYPAPDGHEYAIVGTNTTTSVVDLADPRNPVEVASFPGAASTWRDMKHFGEFVYVTTDVGSDGLLVIDMSGAPENITGEFWQPEIELNGTTTTLRTCHNIFIDEDGYAYLAGCNINSGGNLIIDLFTNPGQPEFVGATDPRYSHDAMVQNNLLYSSDIQNGFFSVIDVTDKMEPITLSTQTTTMTFTHNAWVSTDNNFLFTTDERGNANVDSYDISDLTDIKRLDTFQPEASKGTGTIPHNTHYFDGYLVTSWYTDGVRIIDASRPDNLIEVAFYDTFPQDNAGFNGVWGVTPYLPSGLVIASDINTGLYVFEVDYKRAAYLEGVVTDANTGVTLDNVSVIVEGGQAGTELTNAVGEYKTGQAEAGSYTVSFSALGYESTTMSAELVNGEVTIVDVELIPLQTFALSGTVRSRTDNSPIANAGVLIQGEDIDYEVMTDQSGQFSVNALEGDYSIFAGAWGFENILFEQGTSITQDVDLDILLGTAFMDDFVVDMGWTAESQAGTGDWVRVVPIGTFSNGTQLSNPGADEEGDIGNKAYVTGNSDGGAGDADIDGGTVTLTSPMMDLTSFESPAISYSLWFFNAGGNGAANDNATVRISNGITEVEVETLGPADSEGTWRPTFSFNVADLIEVTSTMQFSVSASDDDPGHLVEAGLDKFLVQESTSVSAADLFRNDLMDVSPNPFKEYITIDFDSSTSGTVSITNVLGQVVQIVELENADQIQLGQEFSKGTYFVGLESEGKIYKAVRIIKQ